MNVWITGSEWKTTGDTEYSVFDIFRKHNVIFAWDKLDLRSEIRKGDLIAVTKESNIKLVGKVISKKNTLDYNSFSELNKDLTSLKFPYVKVGWITVFEVKLYDLEENFVNYEKTFVSEKKGRIEIFNEIQGDIKKEVKVLFNEKIKEKYETKNIFKNENNILDICIKQIKIENYQGIKNINILEIPVDIQWIFLTGENGYGKTSILQAIVIALYGNKDNGQILDKKERIEYLIELKYFTHLLVNQNTEIFQVKEGDYKISENEGFKIKSDEELNIKFNNFVAYGTSRLNKNQRPLNDSKTFNLFNTYGELLDIEDKLINWEKDEQQKKYFESGKKILLDLLKPHITDIKIIREGSKIIVKYEEADSESTELKEFKELATGFKSIIAMIGDMMIRLSENQLDITNFNELNGIVIIDEIDLHLHPKFQREIVLKLTNTFPKIQFIASTHSPIPLLGIPKNSIIIKVDRNKEDGITVEILDIDVTTLTPNSILSSPIFGFENLISINKPNDEFLNTEDDYNKIAEKKRMREELSEHLTPEKAERMFNLLNSEK